MSYTPKMKFLAFVEVTRSGMPAYGYRTHIIAHHFESGANDLINRLFISDELISGVEITRITEPVDRVVDADITLEIPGA